MSFPGPVWNQLKNISKDELISALLKDGFQPDNRSGSVRVFRHPDGRRVGIHYHSGCDTFGPRLLRSVLEDVGWTVEDLERIKLIK